MQEQAINKSNFDWKDIFLGVMTSPVSCLRTLHLDNTTKNSKQLDESRATTAFVLVFAIHLGLGISLSSTNQPAASALLIFLSVFSGILFWIILSALLVGIARYFNKRDITIVRASILTGWAHLPLVFFPSFHLYELGLGPVAALLNLLPLLWFILLILACFKVVLDTSYTKLAFTVFIAPPIILVAITYWLYIIVSYTTLKVIYLIL